jgi:hypothetical protein
LILIIILEGIPFAPYMDPWVVMKKSYLDEKVTRNHSIVSSTVSTAGNSWALAKQSTAHPSSAVAAVSVSTTTSAVAVANKGTSINGQTWYNQSASRAVNQVCLLATFCVVNSNLLSNPAIDNSVLVV